MSRLLSLLRHPFGQGRLIGLLLLADLLILRVWDPDPLVAMRFKFFDMFQQWLPRQEASFPVTIVDIDERSLVQLGQWPWPRSVLASLVNRLRRDGAAAIGFDSVFAEPDRNLSLDTARLLSLPPADLRAALMNTQTNDAVFATALRAGKVVLGESGLSSTERAPAPPRDAPVTPALIGGDPRPFLHEFSSLLENIPELAAAAAGRGNFMLVGEVDGIVRRVPLVVRVGDIILPSLDVELLRVATQQKGYAIQLERAVAGTTSGVASVKVAGVAISTDRNAFLYIRFGPHDPRRFVSAADAVAGRVDPSRFAGRLVLIGASAAGLRDIRNTPLAVNMPGVEIHAQLLENVLAREWLVRPNYAQGLELTIVAAGGLLLIWLVPLVAGRWTLGLHAIGSAGLFGGALYLFAAHSVLLDWFFPILSNTVVYLLLIYIKYLRTERQRKQAIDRFGQYLSPVMVERVMREPPRLGGELKVITVMFCDIREFTSISERLSGDPQALTALINRFMNIMSAAVTEHGGYVDKYIGDSLMAFWNAPLDDPDHAVSACRAALAMSVALVRFNQELSVEAPVPNAGPGAPPLKLAMGIGINTGACVVGNMGSELKFNYSVLGDAVNLASRLESLSKHYGIPIVISESTRRAAPAFAAIELDFVAVVGKTEATRIYGLVGAPEEAETPAFHLVEEAHGRMLAAYRAQRWTETAALIEECAGLDIRLRKLYRRYRRRLAYFAANPLDPDWDGIFRAQSK